MFAQRAVALVRFNRTLIMTAVALALLLGAGAARAGSSGTWGVQIGTAPGNPEDIWITAVGNNVDGWHGGGAFCLVGPLPQGGVGVHTVASVYNIEQGGIFGVDGTPVPPGQYSAFGITEPTITFNMVPGQTFYVIFDVVIRNTDFPLFHVGETVREMLTFDTTLGNNEVNMVLWADFGFGMEPFLNEGTLKCNLHFHP